MSDDVRKGEWKMELKTGKIEFSSEEKQSGKTMLTPQESQEMLGVPEKKRPEELALMRYIKARKDRKVSVYEKMAFRTGYRNAAHDASQQ